MEQKVINLNDLAKDNHQNNIDKGWYEPEPTLPELLCMIHSEVSAVVDAYRNGRNDEIGEELADIILRTLDLSAYLNIDIHFQFVLILYHDFFIVNIFFLFFVKYIYFL